MPTKLKVAAVISQVHFKDGGEPESVCIYIGPLEECKKVAATFPVITYAGKRPVDWAEILVMGVES